MEAFKIIESHSGFITLFLSIATVWLAISTYKMANATRKIFELESRPFLIFSKPIFRFYTIQGENSSNQKRALKIGLEFQNSSRVPVTYKIIDVRLTFDGKTVEEPNLQTLGGIIYPTHFGIFWYGTIDKLGELKIPATGVIEYEIDYSSSDHHRKYKVHQKMRYELNSIDPYNCDWTYLEEGEDKGI